MGRQLIGAHVSTLAPLLLTVSEGHRSALSIASGDLEQGAPATARVTPAHSGCCPRLSHTQTTTPSEQALRSRIFTGQCHVILNVTDW